MSRTWQEHRTLKNYQMGPFYFNDALLSQSFNRKLNEFPPFCGFSISWGEKQNQRVPLFISTAHYVIDTTSQSLNGKLDNYPL